MKNIKIAISGKANSGKNTIASLLVQHMGLNETSSKIVALADPIKEIVLKIYPEASKECLWGPSELRSVIISEKYKDINGNPLTHRQALLELGAYGRKHNINIWLNLLVMDAQNSKYSSYIVSDCRFINELEYLKQNEFYMIRVIRDDIKKIDDPSELDQDHIGDNFFHSVIFNNKSIELLSKEVKSIIANINEYKYDPETAKKLFITKYNNFGNDKFYKFLINYAITKIINLTDAKSISPELELMDYYDKFFALYRKENDIVYLEIAKIFRKAAHKIYRLLIKKNKIEKNNKFLNLV